MHFLIRALFLVLICYTLTEKATAQTYNMMFYIMADNAGACSSINAVQQLASVASDSASYKFYVFWERSRLTTECGDQTVLGQAPWTGARIFQVTSNSLNVIADLGTVDSTSLSVLTNFLSTSKSAFTADNYILTFSGPGGYFTFASQNSASGRGWLYFTLAAALSDAVASLGLPKGKLDLVFIDASYSASQENMQMFSSSTRYFAGYQSIQPSPDYTIFGSVASLPGGSSFDRPLLQAFGQATFNALQAKNPNLPIVSFSIVDSSLISNVTTGLDVVARALENFPQRTFAQIRREALEVDPAPYPITAQSAIDLGYLSFWLTNNRPWPFLQKRWGPDLSAAINNAVVFSANGIALTGASGISLYFPLSNSSETYAATNGVYQRYDFNFNWYSVLLSYLYTIHNDFFFTSPRISLTSTGGYQLIVNTTLDSVVKANTLYGVVSFGQYVLISGSNQAAAPNQSEANNLVGAWDGAIFRLSGTARFYPFVQQIKSLYIVSLVANSIDGPDSLLLKGFFSVGSSSVSNFYVQEGPNVALYTLSSGTILYPATTKPYLTDNNTFGEDEVQTDAESFQATGNTLNLEQVSFVNSGFDNAYVFLTIRNIDDTFGFTGWRIPTANPSSTYLLVHQDRLLTNLTVGFVQKVFSTRTKLKVAVRNTGFRDSSINMIEILDLPSGLTSATVSPLGVCRASDSTLTAVKCLIDFIPAKSFYKFSIVLPTRILVPITLSATGTNFAPTQVIARVVIARDRSNRTRTRTRTITPTVTPRANSNL